MAAMTSLPDPDFIQRDPQAITAEIIAQYEKLSGKTLYPAQIDRLLVDVIAYRETLVRVAIQETAKQCLARFAVFPMLDYLGEGVGVTRLPAQPARTVLRFSVEAAQVSPLLVHAGMRVDSGDGAVRFETDIDAILPVGQTNIDVPATCDTAGAIGNGWGLGQINNLVDTLTDADIEAVNITIPSGGADAESDDRLRERIMLAPETLTTAGSEDAYIARVKAVHQSIRDVAILSPSGGVVDIYPLLDTGLPGSDMLALIDAKITGKRARPFTDHVFVKTPELVDYKISAQITLYKTADVASTLDAARAAAQAFADNRAASLGRDIVPAQVETAIMVAGVYDIELTAPEKIIVARHQWARCTAVNIEIAGVADA